MASSATRQKTCITILFKDWKIPRYLVLKPGFNFYIISWKIYCTVYVFKIQCTFFKNTTYTSFKMGDYSILSNLIRHTFYSHCQRGRISNDIRVELSGKVQGKYISSEKAQDHTVSIPCSQTENAWTIIRRKRKRSDSAPWQKPLHQQKNPKSNVTTQKRLKNFDYTTTADRLWTVSWSNDNHPTGVFKPV